ncbi:MAG: hypothetical protein ACRDPW_06470 [Mycobacteriales bacterium]
MSRRDPDFDEHRSNEHESYDSGLQPPAPVAPPVRPRRRRLRRRQQQIESKPPWYARVLRLQNLQPGSVACFIFLEGSIALSALLAFAELVSWWAVLVLPLTVAAMVKLNDYVAGKLRV